MKQSTRIKMSKNVRKTHRKKKEEPKPRNADQVYDLSLVKGF